MSYSSHRSHLHLVAAIFLTAGVGMTWLAPAAAADPSPGNSATQTKKPSKQKPARHKDSRNEAACAPTAPNTNCERFVFTGSDQAFIVPAGVSQLDVRMWGAGGAGDTQDFGAPRGLSGGGGGFTLGTVAVTAGQSLTVTSGGGGVPASTAATYGGGGAGGAGGFPGSSGGGMSALWDGAFGGTPLLIAGGGGGISVGTPIAQDGIGGGGGGGAEGSWDFSPPTSGQPGTQPAGGAAPTDTTGCTPAAMAGSQFAGGSGASVAGGGDTTEGGGGGGGGYFGGGGGRCQNNSADTQNGGGGGGSGFIGGAGVSAATTTVGMDGDRAIIGDPAPPAGVSDPYYLPNIGEGAHIGGGGNGEVVIQWVQVPAAPAAEPLPVTGSSVLSTLLPIGGSLVVAGGLLVYATRRRTT